MFLDHFQCVNDVIITNSYVTIYLCYVTNLLLLILLIARKEWMTV